MTLSWCVLARVKRSGGHQTRAFGMIKAFSKCKRDESYAETWRKVLRLQVVQT